MRKRRAGRFFGPQQRIPFRDGLEPGFPARKEVLKLPAEGYTNRAIAEMRFISVKTVEKHRSNLMSKLKLHNVAGLTALAVEKGLVASK